MKKYKLLFLFLWLFSCNSVICAISRKQMSKLNTDWERNAIVAIELSAGMPMSKLAEEALKDIEVGKDEKVNMKVGTNANIGLMLGYNFTISQVRKIGVEAGLVYGFSRGIEVLEYNLSLKEDHLYLPCLLTVSKQYNLPFYFANTAFFGYEWNIPFAATLKQNGYHQNLNPDFQGDKNLNEYLPDLPKSLGNILLGARLNFPAGIYAQMLLKINLNIFNLKSDKAKQPNGQLDGTFIQAIRVLSADLLTINIGFNIMDLYYPKEILEAKTTYKYKRK
ncbi:MAG: hypothetical protein ACK4M7_10425 [Burkholderiales bacterium]